MDFYKERLSILMKDNCRLKILLCVFKDDFIEEIRDKKELEILMIIL